MPRMQNQSFTRPSQNFVITPTTTELKLKILAEKLKQQIQVDKSQTFEENYVVTQAIGSFKVGDSVKGLSYEQIFIKLLGLQLNGTDVPKPDDPGDEPEQPDTPDKPPVIPENPTIEQVIEHIIAEQTTIHQVNAFGELEEVPYVVKTFDENTYTTAPKELETIFYKVVDTSGDIIEAGYQHLTISKEMYYMVALPSYMIIGQNTQTQTWDEITQCWTPVKSQLTELPDDIRDAFMEAGLAVPVVPEGYTLWADLNDLDPGTTYRFVLI